MRRVIFLIAVAAIFSSVAEAGYFNVYSDITDVKHASSNSSWTFIENSNPAENALSFSGMLDITVTGDSYVINSGYLSMGGSYLAFTLAGAYVELDYNGVRGEHNMTEGYIDVYAESTPYQVISMDGSHSYLGYAGNTADPIDFSGENYCYSKDILGNCQGSVGLSGIDFGSGTVKSRHEIVIDLAGIPAGIASLDDLARATTSVTVFDIEMLQFMEGSITLVEMPVPAAAWLFGSALLGLGGVSRRRS